MKTLNKILPLTALSIVGTIPVVATSCSNVYVDLYSKLYQPSFKPADADELTSPQAIKLYTDRFVNNEGDAVGDFYWGSSIYCREVLGKSESEQEKVDVLAYLNHIYDVKVDLPEGATRPVISYKLKAQIQLKHTAASGSYSVRSYDLYWEINNLEFWATHYKIIKTGDITNQMWSLCPFKFDHERGVWWQELKGNEQVKFDFKTVIKGYGVDGGQNYVWEGAEAAIVDESHKYVPELSEVYTAVMLFDTYYLSQISPKMDIKDTWFRAAAIEGGETFTNKLQFIFGPKTQAKGGTVELKLRGKPYVSHVDGSTLDVKEAMDPVTITVGSGLVDANIDLKFDGKSKTGDVVYYTIQADHKVDGNVDWTDYFFITSIVDND